jgi:hypothetical protein
MISAHVRPCWQVMQTGCHTSRLLSCQLHQAYGLKHPPNAEPCCHLTRPVGCQRNACCLYAQHVFAVAGAAGVICLVVQMLVPARPSPQSAAEASCFSVNLTASQSSTMTMHSEGRRASMLACHNPAVQVIGRAPTSLSPGALAASPAHVRGSLTSCFTTLSTCLSSIAPLVNRHGLLEQRGSAPWSV